MTTTIAPVEQHIHVDLDVDRERKFHYRSLGHDGHAVVLHRRDTVTFTCNGEFSIRFDGPTPFQEPVLYSRHCFITAHVRTDAPVGAYEYTVEIVKGDELVADPASRQIGERRPEIIIE
jgi:hypothetical protein